MIDRKHHPMGWASLLYDLEDARDHLDQLLQDMTKDPLYSETEFRVDLGHVYAHLNRAWYRRQVPQDIADTEWRKSAQFPADLEPIG
jgi:hypothetical protein